MTKNGQLHDKGQGIFFELVQQAVASLPRKDESPELFRAIVPYRRWFEERLFEESAHYRYNAVPR